MVKDLQLPVEVVGMPIVREHDGLAMSSRNVYLSPDERHGALVLSRSLAAGERMVTDGEWDAERIRSAARMVIEDEPSLTLDYVSVSDAETFEELATIDRPALLLVAARVGSTRLIDNVGLFPADLGPIGRG
jgi:pantoate--beta-alanine ligase